MTLVVSTDPDWIVATLDEHLGADPISGTVLGSVRAHIAAVPEPSVWAATGPAMVAARSSAQFPVVVAGEWTGAALDELAVALQGVPDLAGVSGPYAVAHRVAAALGRPAAGVEPLKLYRLDELVPPVGVPGAPRSATRDDIDLLRAWYQAFHVELDGHAVGDVELSIELALTTGAAVLWVDGGEAVSMAVRRAAEGGSARIGPVYTPRSARGHGYAAAATAEATRQVLESGAIPVLFTDAENALTNRLYPRLGYYLVEDQVRISFS